MPEGPDNSVIPQEKRAAVVCGLRSAFGVTDFEDVRRLTNGPESNLIFRIVVQGHPFLLRIATRSSATIGPAREFACLMAAAEAGLSPRVWYASVEDRISITDFVDAVPFSATEARIQMPALLRRLHALPPFPPLANPAFNTTCMFLMQKAGTVDQFLARFEAADVADKSETAELLALRAQIAVVYPNHNTDLVSSHNDLFKPDNILFDGQRVWLVDWEAAFLNDRYADLAVVANLVVGNASEEEIYLREYFGGPPDEYQRARFFLMRQVAHIFYAMAFLLLASPGHRVHLREKRFEFEDFQRGIWTNEVSLRGKEMKIAFGVGNWEQLLQNAHQPRFREALRIVSDRNACR